MAKKNTQDFPKELLDQLLAGRDPKSALDSAGLIGDLKTALAERMLNAEMGVHLAKEAEAGLTNHRNGTSDKTVLTPEGELELSIPRDRHGRFDPALIRKYCRRFPGFDDKIIARLCARDEHPRHPAPRAGDLRHRYFSRPGLGRHRLGHR
jgi:putative transposase